MLDWKITIDRAKAWPVLYQLIAGIITLGLIGALVRSLHATFEEFAWVAAILVGVFAIKSGAHFLAAAIRISFGLKAPQPMRSSRQSDRQPKLGGHTGSKDCARTDAPFAGSARLPPKSLSGG